VSFFERNRKALIEQGIDPARLPPGQYHTDRFPVLHVGDVPAYAPGQWNLRLFGSVEREMVLGWDDLVALPATHVTTDIHCVTKWSKFDTQWTGVKVADLFALAGGRAETTHVVSHAEYGYTANTPFADATFDNCLVAYEYGGEPIEPIHGGPVRLLIPHLYFWKSTKWLRGLEFRVGDVPGFWERNGYHMYGDPWKEQRYWGDE